VGKEEYNVVKTIINHPLGNGNHTTHKNGDDWGMVNMAWSEPHYNLWYSSSPNLAGDSFPKCD